MVMRIYTLTLSPAYDVHAAAKKITACHENLAAVQSREAGGKGVNISRALHNYRVPNTAVVVLGRENSGDFKQSLQQSGLEHILFELDGRIRENITIHCEEGPETRISFTGFSVDEAVLQRVRQAMTVDENTVVTFTGRVPDGISMDTVKAFLRELKDRGAKIVLDSRSFGREDIYDVAPWLIKPNQEEISMFFGCSVESVEDAAQKAKEFVAHGVENAMISLGEQGALLAAGDQVYMAVPPKVEALSTIGAGDSAIAGFVAAFIQGKEKALCLQTAVAFGTAACLSAGSLPPVKADIDRIFKQVEVTALL